MTNLSDSEKELHAMSVEELQFNREMLIKDGRKLINGGNSLFSKFLKSMEEIETKQKEIKAKQKEVEMLVDYIGSNREEFDELNKAVDSIDKILKERRGH
jgi:predicted  nucleic acid-binding Zn-ribbon protein